MNISILIRWFLTVVLLVGVYRETGIFTTILLVLIVIAFEAQGSVNNKRL